MLLPPDPEARRRRLVGSLLDGFDRLRGRGWFTLAGVVVLLALLAVSLLPLLPS